MSASSVTRSSPPETVPFRISRIGTFMSADPGDEREAEGVLNPATAWDPDGNLLLFPRVVGRGNFSRIARARVETTGGVPSGVVREGIALEPERPWERGEQHGGVEDPRVTWIEALGLQVMTYVAFGPLGPRPALAVSRDARSWRRLGPIQFEYEDELDIDFNMYPNKDVVFFPHLVPNARGGESLALLHRPMWDLSFTGGQESAPTPRSILDRRPSIWISYIDIDEVLRDLSALTRPGGHRLVASPLYEWESLKIGAGPPPIPIDEGWLLIHHGVTGTISNGTFALQQNVEYSAGAMILDRADPSLVLARTAEPLLKPGVDDERSGAVANVVFPTASEEIDGTRYLFYGMADRKIGLATIDPV